MAYPQIWIGEGPTPVAHSTSYSVIDQRVIMADEGHDERTLYFERYGFRVQERV